MNDAQFLRALEDCTLPESEFGHAAHIRAAYLYLRQCDFADALARISRSIRNYAKYLGKADRYHETVTVAYMALIQQHICERGDGGGWTVFTQENQELFDPRLLLRFYSPEQLNSATARRAFLLPCSRPVGNEACARF